MRSLAKILLAAWCAVSVASTTLQAAEVTASPSPATPRTVTPQRVALDVSRALRGVVQISLQPQRLLNPGQSPVMAENPRTTNPAQGPVPALTPVQALQIAPAEQEKIAFVLEHQRQTAGPSEESQRLIVPDGSAPLSRQEFLAHLNALSSFREVYGDIPLPELQRMARDSPQTLNVLAARMWDGLKPEQKTGEEPRPDAATPAPQGLSRQDGVMARAFAARADNPGIPSSVFETLRLFFSDSLTWARRMEKLRESKPDLERLLRILKPETDVSDLLDPGHPLHTYLLVGIAAEERSDFTAPITLERFLAIVGLKTTSAAEADALNTQIDAEIDAFYGYLKDDPQLKEAAKRRIASLRSHNVGWQHTRLLQLAYYRRAVASLRRGALRKEFEQVEVIRDETMERLDLAVKTPAAKADVAMMKLMWTLTRLLLLKADSRATNQEFDRWEAEKYRQILEGFQQQGLEIPPEVERYFTAVRWMGPRGQTGRILAIRESLEAAKKFIAAQPKKEKLKITPGQNLYRLMTAGFTPQPWTPAPDKPVGTPEAAQILGWGYFGPSYGVTAEDADARRKELEKMIRDYDQDNKEPLLIEALTRTSFGVGWQTVRWWILAYVGAAGDTIEDEGYRKRVMDWREVISDPFVRFIGQTVQQPEDKKLRGKKPKLVQNRTAVARMKYLRTLLDVLLRAREDPDFQRAVLLKAQEMNLYVP